jgi:hypothetical protein
MPQDPMTVVFDTEGVATLLRNAAKAMAWDINSSLVWEDENAPVLYMIGKTTATLNAALKLQSTEFVRGTEVVDTNLLKLKTDTDQFFTMFSQHFVSALAKSPAAAVSYLREKQLETQRAWENLKYKFEAARKVQSLVQASLTEAVDDTFRIKMAAELGMAIVGAFVPLWWVPLGVGVVYTLATETAKTAGEVDCADVGVLKDTMSKPAVEANLASQPVVAGLQAIADKSAEDAEKLLEHAERVSDKLEAECLRKMDRLAAKGGEELNRAARKQIGRELQKIAAEKEAVKLAKVSAGTANALKQGCRIGGIGVAILFMKDDLVRAWKGYTATEREELLKR